MTRGRAKKNCNQASFLFHAYNCSTPRKNLIPFLMRHLLVVVSQSFSMVYNRISYGRWRPPIRISENNRCLKKLVASYVQNSFLKNSLRTNVTVFRNTVVYRSGQYNTLRNTQEQNNEPTRSPSSSQCNCVERIIFLLYEINPPSCQ